MGELMVGLAGYVAFYNGERPHQSLSQQTPEVVYRTARGGGAVIVDTFARAVEAPPRYAPQGIPPPQKQDQQQRQNRGSAVQLLVKSNVQLKLNRYLS
jgi:hypothetical protein